jgi:hypothetical protein
MIKAIGYLFIAYIVMQLGKIVGKKLFPEDF